MPVPSEAARSPETMTAGLSSAPADEARIAETRSMSAPRESGTPSSWSESSGRIVTTMRSPRSSTPFAPGRSTLTPRCSAMSKTE